MARPPRPWDAAVLFERDAREAAGILRAEERAACWALVAAIVRQAVDDLRTGTSGDLESAITYVCEPAGEFATWHADALGLDLAAVRERARALLAARFGREAAERLWREPALARPRRRRRWAA